jgi:hypothetical protein
MFTRKIFSQFYIPCKMPQCTTRGARTQNWRSLIVNRIDYMAGSDCISVHAIQNTFMYFVIRKVKKLPWIQF